MQKLSRRLLTFLVFAVAGSNLHAQAVAPPAATANASVIYFIPGMGFTKFNAGTSLEQAFENICLDPETPVKFPEVPCEKLMAEHKSSSPTDLENLNYKQNIISNQSDRQTENSPKEINKTAKWIPLFLGIITGIFLLFILQNFANRKRTELKGIFYHIATSFVKASDFKGHSSRLEYWTFFLFATMSSFTIGILATFSWSVLSGSSLGISFGAVKVFSLGTALGTFALPELTVSVRRMRDADIHPLWTICRYGFYLALGFIAITRPDPKDDASTTTIIALGLLAPLLYGGLALIPSSQLKRVAAGSLPRNANSTASIYAPDRFNSAAEGAPVDLYAVAGGEVLSGKLDAGLWARALVEGNGVEGAVRASYVRARVNQLQLEETQRINAAAAALTAQHQKTVEFAARHGVALEEAEIMMPLDITFNDGRYVVYDVDGITPYQYTSLKDAEAHARDVVRKRSGIELASMVRRF